jgi:hypothetical protein
MPKSTPDLLAIAKAAAEHLAEFDCPAPDLLERNRTRQALRAAIEQADPATQRLIGWA